MKEMRLNKYLASCNIASRRKCEELILSGLIKINGEMITSLSTKVDPKDLVECGGQIVSLTKKRYFLFYKPMGVLSTFSDPFGRPCLQDYLKNLDCRVFSVGRLDADSEGLLFLTNDGNMSHRLQHPKYKVEKHYEVLVNRELGVDEMIQFQTGIILEEGKTAPAEIRSMGNKHYTIILKQGWNRQIRRMMEKFNIQVKMLKRVQIGHYKISSLKAGSIVEINLKKI